MNGDFNFRSALVSEFRELSEDEKYEEWSIYIHSGGKSDYIKYCEFWEKD